MKPNPFRLRWAIQLVPCLLVALTGCSANAGFGPFKPTFHHYQLAPLSIRNFRRLAAFTHLAPNTDPDYISSLLTYLPRGQAHPHTLLAVDGSVYTTNFDGSGEHKINLPYPCYSPGISPDGGWLACPNETDQSNDAPQLQIASLANGSATIPRIALLAAGGFYSYPTWSPDGKMLAILHDQTNNGSGCSIGLYMTAPPYAHFKHLTELANTPDPKNFGGCYISGLAWSPDGRWLAIESDEGISVIAIALLLQTYGGSVPLAIDLHKAAIRSVVVTPMPTNGGWPSLITISMAWNPLSSALTYLLFSNTSSPREEIITYNPVLNQQQVMLQVSLAHSTQGPVNDFRTLEHLDTLAWTPDGQKMLVVVNQSIGCVDCTVTYPSEVYVYTPSSYL